MQKFYKIAKYKLEYLCTKNLINLVLAYIYSINTTVIIIKTKLNYTTC